MMQSLLAAALALVVFACDHDEKNAHKPVATKGIETATHIATNDEGSRAAVG